MKIVVIILLCGFINPPKKTIVPDTIVHKSWHVSNIYNQGTENICTVYAVMTYLDIMGKSKPPLEFMRKWRSQGILFENLVLLGYIKSFQFSRDINTIINHIETNGPVLLDTTMYEGMVKPTQGYITDTGDRKERRHTMVLYSYDNKFYGLNSWGTSWNPTYCGGFIMSRTTLQRMLDRKDAGVWLFT